MLDLLFVGGGALAIIAMVCAIVIDIHNTAATAWRIFSR